MQAVVLAAGRGSRLGSLTLNRSKAMLPVLGKPIVERVMEDLVANGVADFVLVVSPDDRLISRHFRCQSALQAEVRLVYQPQRLGMANALQCAAPLINGDFILAACDNLFPAGHVGRLLAAWQTAPQPNAVLTLMPVEPDRWGSVAIVEMDGPWIARIVEKPPPNKAPSNVSSLPLYCFSPRILDYLSQVPLSPRGEYELQDAIQMLIAYQGCVRGVSVAHRLTLTSPADLLALNRHYLNQSSAEPLIAPRRVGDNTQFVIPLRIESGCIVGSDCTIGPNVYLERDCRVGDGVHLQNTVVLSGAVVPDGAAVQDQVITKSRSVV